MGDIMVKSLCARGAAGVLSAAALTILAGGSALATDTAGSADGPASTERARDSKGLVDFPGTDLTHANSGTGNTGYANAGNGNTGYANAGTGNIGSANAGDVNQGNANAGTGNIGNANAGVSNCGNANAGVNNHGNVQVGVHADNHCKPVRVERPHDGSDRPYRPHRPKPAPTPAPEPRPQAHQAAALANTGVDPLTASVLGAGMMLGGGALLMSRRRVPAN